MRTRTKYLLGILGLVFVVGVAIDIGTTIDDIKRLAVVAGVILWIVALVGFLSRRDFFIPRPLLLDSAECIWLANL